MSNLLQSITFLALVMSGKTTIYVYHTRDGSSVEYYDCLYLETYLYCLHPIEPISLDRDRHLSQCYHNGTSHTFHSMKSTNISASMVLYDWRSTLEMVERYEQYLHQSTPTNEDDNQHICECKNPSSFGKNCEYLLPKVNSFSDASALQTRIRRDETWRMQVYGDILCYKTLDCNSGILCLDWRDICDGRQQCMFGYDEENCDLLEFHECEEDEYRCMNGMCIPDLYFLNGDYDCSDLTDEKGIFYDGNCIFEHTSLACNERHCAPNQWSCGDGECIESRTAFQDKPPLHKSCESRRDHAHICETHGDARLWTLPNGLCIEKEHLVDVALDFNLTTMDRCQYCLKCVLSQGGEISCKDKNYGICLEPIDHLCSSESIQYPLGAIIAPYIFYYYSNIESRQFSVPDRMVINGTIKCRGYLVHYYEERSFFNGYKSIDWEHLLCNGNKSNARHSEGGYDPFCYNNSKTFNNQPYRVYDVCTESKECISAYRIHDGYRNCATKSDENQTELIPTLCSNLHRYRFACFHQDPMCLTVNSLGNTFLDCRNNYDESWMGFGSTISKLNCNNELKDDCLSLRSYIEQSWLIKSGSSFQVNTTRPIPFRAYCDTFWDYSSKKDEDPSLCRNHHWECLEDQWQCQTGQCIHNSWILDDEWDCSDASDEEAILFFNHYNSSRNVKIIKPYNIVQAFNQKYSTQPLRSKCDARTEFPCYRINGSDPLQNDQNSRPCISLEKLGDGHIDCEGGIDEQNTIEYCKRTTMLGKNFKCLTSDTCHSYFMVCDQRCLHTIDDQNLCYSQSRSPGCNDPTTDFLCYNGTCIEGGSCNDNEECADHEDEYMCSDSDNKIGLSSNAYYRRDKEYGIRYDKQPFRLPIYPSDLNTKQLDDNTNRSRFAFATALQALKTSVLPYKCNRGIGVTLFNGSIVCFCPQSYYGDKCQYYNDRLTLIFHMNYSQSIYANFNLLLKMVVLFLHNNETIDSYEFHDRHDSNVGTFSKKTDHFVYSRAKERLVSKQRRYFNRSNIIHEHPYSIRIEAYQIHSSATPKLIAVWQYTIYFDFLPSYRLVKILYLKSFTGKDPCSSHHCHPRQLCHRLHNDPSRYICLCPDGIDGNNCSKSNPYCTQGYCFGNALCKSNYHGLLKGNHFPYCICPSGYFGIHCHLKHEQCLSNPCQHNGTCSPRSTPGLFHCRCQSSYDGDQCERKRAVSQLHIQKRDGYRGAVVQYLNLNQAELNLVLLDQKVYHSLPKSLSYLNTAKEFAELVLVRLYSDVFLGLYLIALHINMSSVNGSTVLNESSRCLPVRDFFGKHEG